MTTQTRKGATLNPADMTDPDTASQSGSDLRLIDQILGPGVTIIGSEDPIYRYIIEEQMAEAIASGAKFLGLFETRQSNVLYVAHGPADYHAVKARMEASGAPTKLKIVSSWSRIEQGGIRDLQRTAEMNQNLKAVFLGDFDEIKSTFAVWSPKMKHLTAKDVDSSDPFIKQGLIREMTKDNIRRLRDFSIKYGVSIVLGHDLNTQGKLYNRDGLRHRDTEIRLRNSKRQFKLEVGTPSSYIPPVTLDLEYDPLTFRFSVEEGLVRKMTERDGKKQDLTEKRREIVNVLMQKGALTASQIAAETGQMGKGIYKKLEALTQEGEAAWLLTFNDGRTTYYFLNPAKNAQE